MAISQPPFWLEVKKEYIIENFENLLVYLKQYNYVESEDNIDFNKTFNSLKEVVYGIFKETYDDSICNVTEYCGLEESTLIRIIASYLLVCSKKGEQDVLILSKLIDRLVLINAVKAVSVLEKLQSIVFECLCKHSVSQFGYGWNQISDKESFSPEVFTCMLANTVFCKNDGINDSTVLYYENKGLALVNRDKFIMAPMNYADYSKSEIQTQLDTCRIMQINVCRRDKSKISSFSKLVEMNALLMSLQEGVKPSPEKHLKVYNCDNNREDIIVQITYIDNYIYARTVDPEYEVIKGSIYIKNSQRGVRTEDFIKYLKVNDYVKVRLQNNENIPFVIDETFEESYKDIARESIGDTLEAIYYNEYSLGSKWLTENGLLVNIRRTGNEDFGYSDNDIPHIKIRITEAKNDLQGNFIVNGCYADDYMYVENDEFDLDEFIEDSKDGLLDAYLDRSVPDFEIEEQEIKEEVDTEYILALSHICYRYSELNFSSTQERYENLMAARMLGQMCEASEDLAFITHEMEYIYNLVRFAKGEANSELKLSHDAIIDGNEEVIRREKYISILKSYKENVNTNLEGKKYSVEEKLQDLVSASNILVNKISEQEINRIKKGITEVLEVSDMYQNNANDSTYYGEESDTLEFKSSIVFPPVNKRGSQEIPAEPTRQKWEILKAVCGFLNSMSGGEILLGVRDDGSSCGLKDDLNYLYTNGKISEPTMDKLSLYVKYTVDGVFYDDSGVVTESRDITETRVRYVIDHSKEGNEILRIKVSPYEYGIVQFRDKESLPDGISDAYLRSSNSTVSLNAETKRQLSNKKLTAKLDENTTKILALQQAKKNRRQVILKDYISRNGMKNRTVEPYKLLFDRKAIICYDCEHKGLREYKIQRFSSVESTEKKWKNYQNKYESFNVDIFDMLQSDAPSIHIILKLEPMPYNLLLEECVGADNFIKKNNESDSDRYPWILDTNVYSIYGVGRFYIGLANHIKIVKGDDLKKYVKEYIEKLDLN